jgi:hypothetical protein
MEEVEEIHEQRHTALTVWALCLCILLGPSLFVWIVRGVGFAAQCAPGPDLCHGMTLGAGLRDTLSMAWAVGTNTFFLIIVAMIATIACFFARRPLLGAICLLLLPIAALVVPMLAVFVSKYDGCQISQDGIGDCTLWGAKMGMSFHTAANVPDIVFGFVPYSFALALMLGLLGWFFARPREAAPRHATARMHRLDDR